MSEVPDLPDDWFEFVPPPPEPTPHGEGEGEEEGARVGANPPTDAWAPAGGAVPPAPAPAGEAPASGTGSARTPPSGTGSGRGTGTGRHLVLEGRPEPGQELFGRYKVIEMLGRGGMGTVWLVNHLGLNRRRALKLITPAHDEEFDAQARQYFRREAETMAALEHPNSVQVHDCEIGPSVAYIEMEYVRGATLTRWLEAKQPLPLPWVGHLLGQLCGVLQAAHDLGIVHRDLKPSNLMILEGGEPGREVLKVLDFGIAKLLRPRRDDETEAPPTSRFLGTAHYASPEQIKSPQEVGTRSDLYSLGVVLYEMLTGVRPFRGDVMQQMLAQVHEPPPPFAAQVQGLPPLPRVEACVMRCLCKDPSSRPESARALAEEFSEAVRLDARPAHAAAVAPPADPLRTQQAFAEVVPAPRPGPAPTVTPAPRPRPESTPPLDSTQRMGELPPFTPQPAETQRGLSTFPGPAAPAEAPATGSATRTAWDEPPAARPSRQPRRLAGAAAVLLLAGAPLAYVALRPGREGGSVTKPGGTTAPPATDPPNPTPVVGDLDPSAGFEGKSLADSLRRWAKEEFEPGEGSRPGEWPKILTRKAGQERYVASPHGVYLPEGFEASDERDKEGWPLVLTTRSGGHEIRFLRIKGGVVPIGADEPADGADAPESRGPGAEADAEPVPNAPAHPVTLAGFYLQQTEVKNDQMERFFKARGVPAGERPKVWAEAVDRLKRGAQFCKQQHSEGMAEELAWGSHPAVGIDHRTATEFAAWLKGRLPTEEQWECAARSGGVHTASLWATKAAVAADPSKRANMSLPNQQKPIGVETKPVMSFPDGDLTAEGVYDLAGNVREWCRNAYALYPKSPQEPEPTPPQATEFVVRGDFRSDPEMFDLRGRWKLAETEALDSLGFRVVIECPSTPSAGTVPGVARAGR